LKRATRSIIANIPIAAGCYNAARGSGRRFDRRSANHDSFTHSSFAGIPMSHRPVHAANLPKPVGPYSPGMGFERLVFVSGQGATDPATGQLAGADTAAQTEQCLRNVQAILEAAGSSLQHVLRCGVFLLDMGDFQQMNAVYARMFGEHRPARTTIQAAGLPGEGLRVEIDCIAYVP
jgi:2-iminobutanoate/2-iminopropanoate deaminase